jgi:hypothetical protein
MARPGLFPLVCFLTASIGLFACLTLHATFSGVALTMICSIGILRAFKVHMPPALALGILAFVIKTPNFWYPISVGIGTGALMVCFWVRGHVQGLFTNAKIANIPAFRNQAGQITQSIEPSVEEEL